MSYWSEEHFMEEVWRRFDEWVNRPQLPDDWDPNAPSPPWIARLPHERVERDGYEVPAYQGDVERIEWERAHASA